MTAVRITTRSLIALFAAMALMLAVVLATFSAASSDHAASTWHKLSAASTWHNVTTSRMPPPGTTSLPRPPGTASRPPRTPPPGTEFRWQHDSIDARGPRKSAGGPGWNSTSTKESTDISPDETGTLRDMCALSRREVTSISLREYRQNGHTLFVTLSPRNRDHLVWLVTAALAGVGALAWWQAPPLSPARTRR